MVRPTAYKVEYVNPKNICLMKRQIVQFHIRTSTLIQESIALLYTKSLRNNNPLEVVVIINSLQG
jgi:hypothetical protein